MISERDICSLLSSLLPRGRVNQCFQSDSEIFVLAGKEYLFTTDEFCAEDLFRESNPFVLGWNIAAGAISDIFACGGRPLFYAHALTVARTWDGDFIEGLGKGIAAVLNETGAGFIGGDCGRAESWRCTASVIGSCEGAPVLRSGARPGDLIYVTGALGAGNLEAALRLYPGSPASAIQFPLRYKESELVRKHATSCIDTSDGLLVSLNTLAELNACGYAVVDVPVMPAAEAFCAQTGIHRLLFLCGECGEYELLFTVPPARQQDLESESSRLGCSLRRIGTITPSGRTLQEGEATVTLGDLAVRARDFDTPNAYLTALAQQLGFAANWLGPAVGLKH